VIGVVNLLVGIVFELVALLYFAVVVATAVLLLRIGSNKYNKETYLVTALALLDARDETFMRVFIVSWLLCS
jgi:hypothetical protein